MESQIVLFKEVFIYIEKIAVARWKMENQICFLMPAVTATYGAIFFILAGFFDTVKNLK